MVKHQEISCSKCCIGRGKRLTKSRFASRDNYGQSSLPQILYPKHMPLSELEKIWTDEPQGTRLYPAQRPRTDCIVDSRLMATNSNGSGNLIAGPLGDQYAAELNHCSATSGVSLYRVRLLQITLHSESRRIAPFLQ